MNNEIMILWSATIIHYDWLSFSNLTSLWSYWRRLQM